MPNESDPQYSANTFCIASETDDWRNTTYTCQACHQSSNTVAGIDHTDDCLHSELVGELSSRNYPITDNPNWEVPLSDSTKQTISEIQMEITLWKEHQEHTSIDNLYSTLEQIDGIRWTAQGSTARIILGLGRISRRGEYHLEDHRPLVVKVSPKIRYNTDHTPLDGNISELQVYQTAQQTGTEDLFAEIVAASPDGMWLVMEGCVPVSMSMRSEMGDRDILFDSGGEQYIYPLVERLGENGWFEPDYKHRNVGVTEDGNPVMIDYGTRIRHVVNMSEEELENKQ